MDRVEAEVVALEAVKPSVRRLILRYDAEARAAEAAKFVMLGLGPDRGALLPRPFSISDVRRDADGPVTELLFKPVGRATSAMARLRPGDVVTVLGLLGNGFPAPVPGRLPVLVAGGIGNAPFAYHVRRLTGAFGIPARDVTLFLAGRTAADLYIQDFVRRAGVRVVEVTEDGSAGERGRVTDALRRAADGLKAAELFACGPEPMLHATAAFARELGIPCRLSVEEMMACGYGVCNACVVPAQGGGWRKSCVEGPVFSAEELAS